MTNTDIRLAAIVRALDDARWTLTSAESALRKAQPTTGYRSTATLGDAPWDIRKAEQDVFAATVNLDRVIAEMATALADLSLERALAYYVRAARGED